MLEALARRQTTIIFIACSLIIFVISFSSLATSFSMVQIQQSLDLSFAAMQWTSTAYWLFAASFLIPLGQLGDIYGRFNLLLVGIVFYLAGSILLSVGTNLWLLLIGRALHGIGAAGVIPNCVGVLKVTYDKSPQATKSKVLIIWSAIAFAGYAIGSLLGGLMAPVDWRMNFWVMLPPTVLSLFPVFLFRNADRNERHHVTIDYLGVLLLFATVVLFVLLFSEGPDWGWVSAVTIVLYSVLPVVLVLLLFWQYYKKDKALIPFSFFRLRSFWVGVVLFVTTNLCYANLTFFYIIYVESVFARAYSPFLAAATTMPLQATPILGAFIGPWLLKKLGYKISLSLGNALLLAGSLTLYWVFYDTSYVNIWWRFVLCGLGLLFLWNLTLPLAMSDIPEKDSGQAGGIFEVMQFLGPILGVGVGAVWYVESFRINVEMGLNALGLPLPTIHEEQALTDAVRAWPAIIANLPAPLQNAVALIFHKASSIGYNNSMMLCVIAAGVGLAVSLFFTPWFKNQK